MAPELLRKESPNTDKSDVYSFGIILYEVYSRKDPYPDEDPEEVLRLVADKNVNKRPLTPPNMPKEVNAIMLDCVQSDPEKRPTFEELDTRLKRIDPINMNPGQVGLKGGYSRGSVTMHDVFPKKVRFSRIGFEYISFQ